MKFNTSEKYSSVIIKVSGKLQGGPEAAEFHELLEGFIKDDRKNIVVDLGDVKYVNSSGIGILVRGFTTLKNAGGDLRLAAISPKVNGVLAITKLNQVFTHFPTVDEAARSFE